MKAEVSQQRSLLELAECDAEISRVEHRAKNLPEQAALENAQAALREDWCAVVAGHAFELRDDGVEAPDRARVARREGGRRVISCHPLSRANTRAGAV